jgi:lysozyme
MNVFRVLRNRFYSLPRRLRFIIWTFLFMLFTIWTYYRLFRANPNQWRKVFKLGISVPLKYKVHGIDVSHHNGEVDWKAVRKIRFGGDDLRIEFAFLKATEGVTHADRQFERNWEHVKKSGLKRGAYHFYIPWRDPEPQAKNFINSVELEEGDFAPVLDIEQNSLKPDSQIIDEIGTWLRIVEEHYHKKPIIYTNPNFYKKFIEGNYDDYPLWIADYSNENLKGYHGNLWFWQHNKKAWVNGIDGGVDFNAFLGSMDELEDLCIGH